MKSKKIFVLVSSLALLLAACNKPASTSQSQSGSESANPTTSETSNPTSDSGQTEVAVTALTINKATLSLEAGKSDSLSVTVTPENASNTKVTWETSDATVATVSSLGKVTAVKVGTATITAKSVSNPTVTATCAVTVTEEGGKYGSVNKPKTVAEILAIAAQECKESNDKTAEPVYVKGIVHKAPTYNAEKGYSSGIYLKDALTDEKDLWVYSANHDATKIPYQNDEVVLHGYLMNYNGTIEITNVTVGTDKIYPEIDSVTRGTSTITYSATHGAFNAEAPKSAKNNAEIQFSVTPDNGYKVDNVTVNGDALAPQADGSYKTYVKGNMAIVANISEVGVDMKTATMETKPETSTNMTEGNNAAAVGLDADVFDVRSDKPTGLYAGLNAAGNIRLYNGYNNADDKTLGTKVTVSSRKVTIKKIDITLASTTVAGLDKLEVKAGDTVVTGAEGAYEINNAQFSLKNVSNASVSDQIHISKVVISYVENADVAATAIAVSPKTLTLKVGDTGFLAAALTPANATDSISWKSSDEAKATVDATGKVTAVAVGNVTVTAFIDADNDKVIDDGELKDTAAVTIEAAEVINYGTAEAPLTVAEAKAVLDKTGDAESKQPLFVKGIVSTNTAYASDYGNYSEIWLQNADGTVAKEFEIYRGKAADSITNVYGAENSLAGAEIVAKGFGKIFRNTYELTTSSNEPKNPEILSVVPPTATNPTGITLDKTTAEVNVGDDITLKATLAPAGAVGTVVWKSSDETKATVEAGKVTGVAEGNVTITAFVDADKDGALDEGELKAECAVTVKAAENINYGTAEAPLTIAEAKAVLDKTGEAESKQPLFVKGIVSTNTAYASNYGNYSEIWFQNADGTVAKEFEIYRGKAADSITSAYAAADSLAGCEVVAKGYGKIYKGTYELTTSNNEPKNPEILSVVPPAAVDPTEINLDKATAEVNVGSTVTLKATLAPAGAVGTIVWKSSDETKATVNAGVVAGVAEGNVTITAFVDADKDGVLDEGELKAECAVTVKAATARAELPYTGNVANGSLPEGWTGSGAAFASSYYALKSNGAYAQAVALFDAQSKIKVDVKGICNGTSNDSTVTVYGLGDDGKVIEGVSATYTPDKASATNAAAVDGAATVKSVTLEGTGITGVKIELTTKGHNYVLVSFVISVVA